MRRINPWLVGVLTVSACSCDGEGEGPQLFDAVPELVALEARLSAAEVIAGGTVVVECAGIYDDGTTKVLAAGEAELAIDPGAGLERRALEGTGLELVARVAGRYTVRCEQAAVTDSRSATLTVTPGAAVRIVASLDRTTSAAGEPVTVSCAIEDAEGNASDAPAASIDSRPARGVTVSGRTVTGDRPGLYEISCALDALPQVPAMLAVTAGTPVSIVATLDRYTVLAGERVAVTCTLEDALGNDVPVDTDFTVTPAPATADEDGFVPHAAGEYAVACVLASPPLTSAPVALTVNPGLPATIEITGVVPMKAVYGRTELVELTTDIRDAYGNVVPAATLVVSGNPQTAAVPSGGARALLVGDGQVELIVRVSSPTHQNLEVSDSITLTVDGTPPQIEILFPARAQIVTAAPGVALQIRGRVTDAMSPVTSLTVNGAMVSVGSNGEFTTSMTPAWGVNLIEASASDGAGNVRGLAQTYELASSYRRAGPGRITSGRIMDGLIAHLGPAAFDDNNADVDDLATIARLAIQNMNIRSLIPSPVTTFNSDCSIPFVTIRGALRLYVDDVRFGAPIIDITPVNGGLRLRVEVPAVQVALHTAGDVCDIGVGLSGSASATRIVVTGDLLVSASGGQAMVRMPSRSVQISGLRINLNLPSIIDWAVDGIINLFSGAIANSLEDAFGDVIGSEIPPVVEGFLESMELATGFTLPAPLALRLDVNTRLGMLAFDPSGGDLGQDATIYATGAITPEPVGGILQETTNIPSFGTQRSLAVALGYDLLNQALYSVWYGGALSIDLDETLFPSQQPNGSQMMRAEASASALLPPVLAPSGDPQWPVEVQLGDVQLDVDLDGVPGFPTIRAVVYASLFARASVTIDASGQLQLALAPNPRIALDIATPLDGIIDMVAFGDQLETTISGLAPLLIGQVLRGIPLPTFDLSSMAGGYLPPGIVLGLGNAAARFHPSYVILEGSLVQVP